MLTAIAVLLSVSAGVSSSVTTCGLNSLGAFETRRKQVGQGAMSFSYVLGAVVGGMMFGAALMFMQISIGWLVPEAAARAVISVVLLGGLLVLQISHRNLAWLAGNFRVPAPWVTRTDKRSGFLWGLMLGLGALTEAPYLVFHAALVAAVLQPYALVALAVGLLFASARIVTTVVPGFRIRILRGMDVQPQNELLVNLGPNTTTAYAAAISQYAMLIACAAIATVLVSSLIT